MTVETTKIPQTMTPATPEYWANGGYSMPEGAEAQLRARYDGVNMSPYTVEDIIHNVSMATLRHATHEQLKNSDTQFYLQQHRDHHFGSLEAHEERIGEFLQWFSGVAHEFFSTDDHVPLYEHNIKRPDKLGSPLFGGVVLQWGDWQSTAALDKKALTIKDKLSEVSDEVSTVEYDPKDTSKNTYRYFAFQEYDGRGNPCETRYAILERRRKVADIAFEAAGLPVHVFKRSTLLLLPMRLPQELRTAANIHTGSKEQRTRAAEALGPLAEQAIFEPAGVTKDLLPISAQYVAMVKRPVTETTV